MRPRVERIGVIGDVHAESVYLHESIEYLKKLEPDVLLCTGDVADGPGDFDDCCEILARNRVLMVMGNHDRWLLAEEMRTLLRFRSERTSA